MKSQIPYCAAPMVDTIKGNSAMLTKMFNTPATTLNATPCLAFDVFRTLPLTAIIARYRPCPASTPCGIVGTSRSHIEHGRIEHEHTFAAAVVVVLRNHSGRQ